MEGARHRLADRAPEPGGDPVAQLARRPAAEGQHQDLLDRHARLDARDRGLDERRGLAGTRAGQHQQRAAGMFDDRALGGVEHRRGDRRRSRQWSHQPIRRAVVHGFIPARHADGFGQPRPGAGQFVRDGGPASPPAVVPATVPATPGQLDPLAGEADTLGKQPLPLLGVQVLGE